MAYNIPLNFYGLHVEYYTSTRQHTVEPVVSDPLGEVTIRSDNRRAKITGLNRVAREGLRSDN